MVFFPLSLIYRRSDYSEQLHLLQSELISIQEQREEIFRKRISLVSLYFRIYILIQICVIVLVCYLLCAYLSEYLNILLLKILQGISYISTFKHLRIISFQNGELFSIYHLILYASISSVLLIILNLFWWIVIRRILMFFDARREAKSLNKAQTIILNQRKLLSEMTRRYRYDYVHELVVRYGKSLRRTEQEINGSVNISTQTTETDIGSIVGEFVEENGLVLKPMVSKRSIGIEVESNTEANMNPEREQKFIQEIRFRDEMILRLRAQIQELRNPLLKENKKPIPPTSLLPQSSDRKNLGNKGSWLDKVVGKVLGNQTEECIALICDNCHAHNGLKLLENAYDPSIFKCFECGHRNIIGGQVQETDDLNKDILNPQETNVKEDIAGSNNESTEEHSDVPKGESNITKEHKKENKSFDDSKRLEK